MPPHGFHQGEMFGWVLSVVFVLICLRVDVMLCLMENVFISLLSLKCDELYTIIACKLFGKLNLVGSRFVDSRALTD